MSKYYALKVFNTHKRTRLSLAVCEVTGISITLDVPAIPSKVFTYNNPLAIPANAIGIASLSYTDKKALSKEVLAGAILTLLNHYSLSLDKMSSIERNSILSSCSYALLHSFLSLFTQNSKARILSFNSFTCNVENIELTVSTYIDLCNGRVYSSDSSSSFYPSTSVKKIEKKAKNLSPEIRTQIKAYINEIDSLSLFSAKFISILSLIAQKNNLFTLSPVIREKIIAKLSSLEETPLPCKELVKIIKSALVVEEDITQHFTESRVKKSLSEILKEKLSHSRDSRGSEAVTELTSTSSISSISSISSNEIHFSQIEKTEEVEKVEDLFFPTFPHRDCPSCEYEYTSCKTLAYCYLIEKEAEATKIHTKVLMYSLADEELPTELEEEAQDFLEELESEQEEQEGEEQDDLTSDDNVQSEEDDNDEF